LNVLRVADLAGRLDAVLELAAEIKRDPAPWLGRLERQTMIAVFERPSTRTRAAFAAAAHRLGMLPLFVGRDELQLGHGEEAADTARSLSSYASVIVVRASSHERIEELAAAARVPVINALSDRHHPCEAVASLMTLRERFGRLDAASGSRNVGVVATALALHRRLAGGRAERVCSLPGRRRADEARRGECRLHPLSAGAAGRRGHGRRARRAGVARLGAGREPSTGRAGAPLPRSDGRS
jgi:aspartate/ornithine carbamoyltransferase-like protein